MLCTIFIVNDVFVNFQFTSALMSTFRCQEFSAEQPFKKSSFLLPRFQLLSATPTLSELLFYFFSMALTLTPDVDLQTLPSLESRDTSMLDICTSKVMLLKSCPDTRTAIVLLGPLNAYPYI